MVIQFIISTGAQASPITPKYTQRMIHFLFDFTRARFRVVNETCARILIHQWQCTIEMM